MQPMIDFSVYFLGALADFLVSEPIIYMFGLICLVFIAKTIKILIH